MWKSIERQDKLGKWKRSRERNRSDKETKRRLKEKKNRWKTKAGQTRGGRGRGQSVYTRLIAGQRRISGKIKLRCVVYMVRRVIVNTGVADKWKNVVRNSGARNLRHRWWRRDRPGPESNRKTIRKNRIDNIHGHGSISDKRLINIHMFIYAWTDWTEARLANARFSRSARVAVTEDRYDDNEDKRGAKFLAGIADRARIPLARPE